MQFGMASTEVLDCLMKEALIHMDAACSAYEHQDDNNRYFVHAHPHGASSWKHERVMWL